MTTPNQPRLAPAIVDQLRARLTDAHYRVSDVWERIGEAGQAGLGRNTTLAAQAALGSAKDPLATLIRLWLLQRPVPRTDLTWALPGLVDPLQDAGLLTGNGDEIRATVDVRPYASDGEVSGWVVSDLTPGLDFAADTTRPDFVLGVSPASTTLAQLTMRRPVARALDLGTGCGVQSLQLAEHCGTVVATELNPRAVSFAQLTFDLSQVSVDLRCGDLYAPTGTETFDLIVTNPPYVISPPTAERLVYREAGLAADGLVEQVVRGGVARLRPGGALQVLGNWAHFGDQSKTDQWAERLAGWFGECDVLALEREVLDRFEYIELWLADAGLAGTPAWEPKYRQWLAYFDSLGIESVGMGWLLAHRPHTTRQPIRRFESWPQAVAQPVGEAFAEFCVAADLLGNSGGMAGLDVDRVLATHWELATLDQETIGRPGAVDAEHVVLRSRRGFCRAVAVDTALGGVLGACDGELPLGALIAAVADLLAVPADALNAQVLNQWPQLVLDGFVIPGR